MFELMLRSMVVGALTTGAAFLFERSLRNAQLGRRHAWTFALMATTLLPYTPRLLPESTPVPIPQLTLPGIETAVITDAAPQADYGVWIWMVLSAFVAGSYLVAYVRLQHARRSWRRERVADCDVHVSDRFGPAIVGFLRPRIVVPEWVRESSVEEQGLIVLHEREHIAARDHLQLLLSIAATIAAPWNPFVWLQARRLRFVVEVDCDQRVLDRASDHARYASLLVDVGSRQMGLMLTPALAEYRNGLERRIAMLAQRVVLNRRKAAALLVVGLVVTAIACESRLPSESGRSEALNVKQETQASLERAFAADESTDWIQAAYPPLLRQAGIGGTVGLRIHVADGGVADEVSVTKSSGREELDQAAVRLATRAQWGNEGPNRKTDYWTTTSITFNPELERQTVTTTPVPLRTEDLLPSKQRVPEEPGFMPYTQRPQLMNREQVMATLRDNYPPLLKAAGMGGTALVWVLVGEDGMVLKTKVKESSARAELDAAAEKVVQQMKFSPALNDNEAVAVWIALPVVFSSK